MYAVIDLEATGGKPGTERIIEVAIFMFDGRRIVDQFITLVRPDVPIPPFVQKLTGIREQDVRTAPRFHEVAKRIVQMTEGAVFVAHNAPFDYRILREEFARLGFDYQRVVLDTIPLAEKFLPGMPAYGLSTLCTELNIAHTRKHRADGDARATVQLLQILLDKDREKYIEGVYLKQPAATGKHKFSDQIARYVKTVGIYYLFNADGRVLYVGKSDQLRVRIDRHFLSTSEKALALQAEVASIRVEETGSLLLADILEHVELKKLKPPYNQAKDKFRLRFGLFPIETEDGVLWDVRGIRRDPPALQVDSLADGVALLGGMAEARQWSLADVLLPRLVPQHAPEAAQTADLPRTVGEALEALEAFLWPEGVVIYLDRGREPGEKTAFWVDGGRFLGYAYVRLEQEVHDQATLK
ncbi:MAG: exonuclease domain-containing protein, partial [Schleiferiaceae bacterium]